MAMVVGYPKRGAPGQLGLGPAEEEAPVGEVGQGVVLGQVRVEAHLAAEPPDHPEGDPEQHHVEEAEPDGQVPVEVVQRRGSRRR